MYTNYNYKSVSKLSSLTSQSVIKLFTCIQKNNFKKDIITTECLDMQVKKSDFWSDFKWGVSTAALQIEGAHDCRWKR